jgi:hypothetical protein
VLYGIWRILIPTKKELEGESEGGLDYEPIYVLNNTGCSKGTKYKGKKNDKSMISPATSSDDRFYKKLSYIIYVCIGIYTYIHTLLMYVFFWSYFVSFVLDAVLFCFVIYFWSLIYVFF